MTPEQSPLPSGSVVAADQPPAAAAVDRVPFFVVGADRSGTTLLRLMLNAHPRLRIPRETHFLTDLMDALPPDRPLRAEEVEQAYTIISTHEWWPQWGADTETLRKTLLALAQPSLAEVIDAVYRRVNNPDGKPRWGDKTPIYIRDIRRLHAVFPAAKFVHVIRDGRDVCVSLRQVAWWGRNILKRAYYWSTSVRRGRDAGAALGPDRYLEITYEALVLDAEGTLRRVCAFLDEAYDPCMAEYYRGAADEIAPGEQAIHAKTLRPPQPADVGRWPAELNGVDVAAFELVAGETMDLVGYARKYPALAPWSRLLGRMRRALGPSVRPLRDRLVTAIPALRQHI